MALLRTLAVGDAGVVERIVATYRIHGHEIDVVEMVDEDGARFELAIDGAMLPDGGSFTAVPSEAVALDVLRRWRAGASTVIPVR